MICFGTFVAKNSALLKGQKSVREARGDIQHFVIRCLHHHLIMLAKGGFVFSQIDHYVKYRSGDDPDQFALLMWWQLEMQSPDHIFPRSGLVVLHKRFRDACLSKYQLVPGLIKVPAIVMEDTRLYDQQLTEGCLCNSQWTNNCNESNIIIQILTPQLLNS